MSRGIKPDLERRVRELAGLICSVCEEPLMSNTPLDAEGGGMHDRCWLAPPAVGDDEKDFQAEFERYARGQGWKVYHTRDSRKSEAGFPDAVCLRGPREVIAELKVGKNRTTAAQDAWLEAYRDAGREVYLWYPRDWPEIMRVLGPDPKP